MARWLTLFGSLAICLAGCGGIPKGRYGVENVTIRGAERMDEESVAACLGTRERPRFRIDIGVRGAPACGEAPFDGDHAIIDFWSWPWEEWPLFDESVLERDVARIERWYRARGYYDARVTATEVVPAEATESDHTAETCGSGPGSDCTVDVTFTVEEGQPVLVERVTLRGFEPLPEGTRERLRALRAFRRGDRFDEALFEETKQRMLRLLYDTGYADARIEGEVKINRERHEAFVVFNIQGGLPSVVGRVCVSGYGDLPPQPMLDVAAIDAGSSYSLRALEGAQHALYALGVFSGVEVSPRREAPPEAEGERGEDGEEEDEEEGTPPARPSERPICNAGPTSVPPGHRAVDIDIHVTPGRVQRWGFGGGLQAGQSVTFGTVTTFSQTSQAAQWDLHASLLLEHRNLFDRLIRSSLEIRPRVIFEMPVFNFTPIEPIPFGIQAVGTLRWPAFLEPRTNFVVEVREDLGPMPYTNFYRNELDAAIGLERSFFDNILYGAIFYHGNWFYPTDRQPVEPLHTLPETASLWFDEIVRLDLRDDPRNPTEGAYFAVTSQQGFQPLGSWDFVRFTGEARGYIPLPFGIVIAGRFEIGVMEIFGASPSLDPENIYQLHQLGPPALQLRGGGASSNRGFAAGLLGDVEQVYVTQPRTATEIASGTPINARPVRLSGGTRLWEASLEVRIPVTTDFGLVLFAYAGDVDRDVQSLSDGPGEFRFDHPQFAFGFGLRYRTIVGPIRFDIGIRPDELQVFGQNSLPPPCTADSGNRCRPVSSVSFGIAELEFPGAFHLTIGEAF